MTKPLTEAQMQALPPEYRGLVEDVDPALNPGMQFDLETMTRVLADLADALLELGGE